jgi:DNA-binding NarL/FixJ family response regulator
MQLSPIKLFIIDDHQMLIDGIKALLENDVRFQLVGQSLSAAEALVQLKKMQIDVVLTDISMPEMGGLEFVQHLRRVKPEQKVLALSMFCSKPIIADMLAAGASGYILKNTGKQELIQALLTIASGQQFLSEEVAKTLHQADEETDKRFMLTAREREIVQYVAQGLSHTEIGEKISISPRTVDTHRTNIMRKLEVRSIAELIKLALQLKIIE